MNYKSVSTSLGGVFILILSIISFIFVPSMIQRGGGALTLGKWNGIPIQNSEHSEFTNQYRNLAGYADNQKLIPSDGYSREAFYHSLAKVAFDSSVIEVAMKDELTSSGYTPPEFLVSKELVGYYLDDNGMYSEAKYKSTPSNTRTAYKKAVENLILTRRYIEDVFGDGKKGGMKMSKAELSLINDMAKRVREFKYINFSFDDYPKEEIKKYGMEKASLFEKYDFSALVYELKDEAQKAYKALKDGEKTFEDALKDISTKRLTDEKGKLEKSERSDIAELFPDNADLDKITSLKVGEMSEVMETSSVNYMIIRCDGETKRADFENEETIKKVFEKMKIEDKGKIEEYLFAKGKEFVEKAKNSNFDAVSKEYGKEVKESDGFSLNYGSIDLFPAISKSKDSMLSSADKNEDFYKELFSLKDGSISSPYLLDSNVVVLSQIKERESSEEAKDNSKMYKNQCTSYIPYYNLIMLLSARGMHYYHLPQAQKAFVNFILQSPKLSDNHELLFSKR